MVVGQGRCGDKVDAASNSWGPELAVGWPRAYTCKRAHGSEWPRLRLRVRLQRQQRWGRWDNLHYTILVKWRWHVWSGGSGSVVRCGGGGQLAQAYIRRRRRISSDAKPSSVKVPDYITNGLRAHQRQCAYGKAFGATSNRNKGAVKSSRQHPSSEITAPTVNLSAQRHCCRCLFTAAQAPRHHCCLYPSSRAAALRCASPLADNESEREC